jgi:peptide/nickel transport system substrate-binding protein
MLRPLLHSRHLERNGWYNPFGFADLAVDELLEEQARHRGDRRRLVVADLLSQVAEKQPYVPVAIPDDIATVRQDRFVRWNAFPIDSPLRYLGLGYRGEGRPGELAIAVTDDRVTRNLNPLAVRFRGRGTVTGMLYEPLGRRIDGAVEPWLASDWHWPDTDDSVCVVTLRSDLQWHDGTRVTAEDIAFTYAFVADTSLGAADAAIPAPDLFGRVTLVDGVEILDDRTLRISFDDAAEPVVTRALTVPILPRHVWEPKAAVLDPVGSSRTNPVTEAIVWDNPEPVGSGPLALTSRDPETSLVLERTGRTPFPSDLSRVSDGGGLAYERLRIQVAPSAPAAVELAREGAVEGTTNLTDADVVPQIGGADRLSLSVDQQPVLYHVGLNVRREHLTNPHFRRAIGRLVDKEYVTDTIMSGYATPVSSPLPNSEWTPAEIAWDGEDPTAPFVGAAGTGTIDRSRARELFVEMGYDYHDGSLVGP